jgi:glycosyltransferase involved in cell wall biosynthesis
MFVTVAICTLNRAESLRRTLESFAAMLVPRDLDWEVVVVNNDCTDHTDEVINAFSDRLPIRREFEPQRGLSRARNRAVDVAKGDYFVWTDDDVVVDPGWLAAYAEAFRRWPDAAVFGGRITEVFDEPVPNWVNESKAVLTFAARDLGEDAVPLSIAQDRLPFGANFSIRAAEQRRLPYNPDLGPGSGRGPVGDEIDVIERLLDAGAIGYWVPNATVTHRVDSDRLTIRSLSRYYAGCSEIAAFMGKNTHSASPRLFGAPRWLWRRLFEEWLLYRFHRWVSPAPVWVKYLQN